MKSQEMDKHMRFLHQYAYENKILFRMSRSGLSIEDISNEALELKKKSTSQKNQEVKGN